MAKLKLKLKIKIKINQNENHTVSQPILWIVAVRFTTLDKPINDWWFAAFGIAQRLPRQRGQRVNEKRG